MSTRNIFWVVKAVGV